MRFAQCTPGLYGLMTQHLASLAHGRLVMALEGGYNAHWAEALTGIMKLSIFPLFVTTLNPYNSG